MAKKSKGQIEYEFDTMDDQDIAEECGYICRRGLYVEASKFDQFFPYKKELELDAYWYNESNEMAFPDTEVGMEKLIAFEKKQALKNK